MARRTIVRQHERRTRNGRTHVKKHTRTLDWARLKTSHDGKIDIPLATPSRPLDVSERDAPFISTLPSIRLHRLTYYSETARREIIYPLIHEAREYSGGDSSLFHDTIPETDSAISASNDRFYIIQHSLHPYENIGVLQLHGREYITNIYLKPSYRNMKYEFSAIFDIEGIIKSAHSSDTTMYVDLKLPTTPADIRRFDKFKKILKAKMGYRQDTIPSMTVMRYKYKYRDTTPPVTDVHIYNPILSSEEV